MSRTIQMLIGVRETAPGRLRFRRLGILPSEVATAAAIMMDEGDHLVCAIDRPIGLDEIHRAVRGGGSLVSAIAPSIVAVYRLMEGP